MTRSAAGASRHARPMRLALAVAVAVFGGASLDGTRSTGQRLPRPSPRSPPHDLHFDASAMPLPIDAPSRRRPLPFDSPAAAVEQIGEVVIIEGDDSLVSDDGSGNLAILFTARRHDPSAIARRFYTVYPDEFDALVILTTFPDNGPDPGRGRPLALAYHLPVQQEVRGLGAAPGFPLTYDFTDDYGATSKHLHSFVNMKSAADYPRYDGLALDHPRSLFYPTIGQEFAHRWLAFLHYVDERGMDSEALLGRDLSHWAPTLQASGSVMDGNHWVDDGHGGWSCVERAVRYSDLDLYAMGLLPASAVPPFFVLHDAVTDAGHVVDPVADWSLCEHVRARREDVTIAQVMAAMGPRVPSAEAAPHDFRVAFLLVTRPGERAGDVLAQAALVERVRRVWEQKFVEYSDGNGRVCTQVSAPCGAALARIVSGHLDEAGGNGDGVIEPGEPFSATFTLLNDGPVAATHIAVTAEARGIALAPTVADVSLGAGGTADVRFTGTFPADPTQCGTLLVAHATARIGGANAGLEFRGFAETLAGTVTPVEERFERGGAGWGVNLDGGDTALADTWAWGRPERYTYGGVYALQPDGGVGGSDGAWFTNPRAGSVASGERHSLGKGRATLWSRPYDLRAASRPRIEYAAWFEALDVEPLQVAPGDLLVLEASNDGVKWLKLDQIDGAEERWRPRSVDPKNPVNGQVGLDLSKPVLFRFTVNRVGDRDLVEAGVDDFRVTSDAPGCLCPASATDLGVATRVLGSPPLGGCSVAIGRGDPRGSMIAAAPTRASNPAGERGPIGVGLLLMVVVAWRRTSRGS